MAPLHNHKRPFSAEHITWALDRITSPSALVLATLLVYRRFRSHDRRHPSWLEVQIRYPWLPKLAVFVVLKTLNRIAMRLAMNRGWRRDRPDWDKEIVVITGGELPRPQALKMTSDAQISQVSAGSGTKSSIC